MALKFYLDANLQKLAADKVGFVYEYIRSASVFKETGILIAKPFFYHRLQKTPPIFYSYEIYTRMWIYQDPAIIDLLDKHSIPDMLKQIQKTAMKDEIIRQLSR